MLASGAHGCAWIRRVRFASDRPRARVAADLACARSYRFALELSQCCATMPPPPRRLSRFASSSPPSPILTRKVSHDLRQAGKTAAKPILPWDDMGAQARKAFGVGHARAFGLQANASSHRAASCPRKRVAPQAELKSIYLYAIV